MPKLIRLLVNALKQHTPWVAWLAVVPECSTSEAWLQWPKNIKATRAGPLNQRSRNGGGGPGSFLGSLSDSNMRQIVKAHLKSVPPHPYPILLTAFKLVFLYSDAGLQRLWEHTKA